MPDRAGGHHWEPHPDQQSAHGQATSADANVQEEEEEWEEWDQREPEIANPFMWDDDDAHDCDEEPTAAPSRAPEKSKSKKTKGAKEQPQWKEAVRQKDRERAARQRARRQRAEEEAAERAARQRKAASRAGSGGGGGGPSGRERWQAAGRQPRAKRRTATPSDNAQGREQRRQQRRQQRRERARRREEQRLAQRTPYERDYEAFVELFLAAAHDARRKAYLRLALVHHPDKGGDAEVFRALGNAWEFAEAHGW